MEENLDSEYAPLRNEKKEGGGVSQYIFISTDNNLRYLSKYTLPVYTRRKDGRLSDETFLYCTKKYKKHITGLFIGFTCGVLGSVFRNTL